MTTRLKSLRVPARLGAACIAAILLFLDAGAAWADPPSWAPAHGRRRHEEGRDRDDDDDRGDRDREEHRRYVGYTGYHWENDYGILLGRCNREAVGALIGGVVGGAIGSNVGRGDGRNIAIVAGTILGAVLGARVGSDMDRADRACFAHTMELGRPGQPVVWASPNGANYTVTPAALYQRDGRNCRNYTTEIVIDGRRERGHGTACQTGDGQWQIVS